MWTNESLIDASTLLLAITSTDFILALIITQECIQYISGLTTSLLMEAKDIVHVVTPAES